MPNSITPDQIERFKSEAKKLRRTTALSHSQALDRIAQANGYSNWSLLMKHNPVDEKVHLATLPPPFRFTRTLDEMREALRKLPESKYGEPSRSDKARLLAEDVCHEFISAVNAVDFAIDYMTCLLAVPRFKVSAASPVYWEMRFWLPYAAMRVEAAGSHVLVNRKYKPVGQVTEAWADYAQFDHLHMRLGEAQLERFTNPGSSTGYLFRDGCPPWLSRQDATAYLERLLQLRAAIKG